MRRLFLPPTLIRQFFIEYNVTAESRQGRGPPVISSLNFALLSPYGGMRIFFTRKKNSPATGKHRVENVLPSCLPPVFLPAGATEGGARRSSFSHCGFSIIIILLLAILSRQWRRPRRSWHADLRLDRVWPYRKKQYSSSMAPGRLVPFCQSFFFYLPMDGGGVFSGPSSSPS